jgi:hypothetical protein
VKLRKYRIVKLKRFKSFQREREKQILGSGRVTGNIG